MEAYVILPKGCNDFFKALGGEDYKELCLLFASPDDANAWLDQAKSRLPSCFRDMLSLYEIRRVVVEVETEEAG